MATRTTIEWTDFVWNFLTGCTPVSEGCAKCYAALMSCRHAGMARDAMENEEDPGDSLFYLPVVKKGGFNGEINLIDSRLDQPYNIVKPSKIFLSSMSDVFHKDVPVDFLKRVFEVMVDCQRHTFQVLTKRPERVVEIADEFEWPSNIWLGTSVEGPRYYDRIDALNQTPAALKFLSVEPLLYPVPDLPLDGISWVIVGGENASGARPMEADWVRDVRDRCVAANVPIFFKQYGELSNNPDPTDQTSKENGGTTKGGCTLDGEIWQQFPLILPYSFERKPSYSGDYLGDLL